MTPDLSVLRDLKARVEGAEGPDRYLDAAIAAALRICALGSSHMWVFKYPSWTAYSDGPGRVLLEKGGATFLSAHYTSSIDAAAALVDQVLADWRKAVYQTGDGYFVELEWPQRRYPARVTWAPATGSSKTEPLAILSAALSALIAKAERSSALDAMVEIGQLEKLP